jgi:hypothetical protein
MFFYKKISEELTFETYPVFVCLPTNTFDFSMCANNKPFSGQTVYVSHDLFTNEEHQLICETLAQYGATLQDKPGSEHIHVVRYFSGVCFFRLCFSFSFCPSPQTRRTKRHPLFISKKSCTFSSFHLPEFFLLQNEWESFIEKGYAVVGKYFELFFSVFRFMF